MSVVMQECTPMWLAVISSEQIQKFVHSKTHGRVQNLTVIIRGGVVHLFGRCTKYHTKQLASVGALEACAAFDGSERIQVHNDIEVY